ANLDKSVADKIAEETRSILSSGEALFQVIPKEEVLERLKQAGEPFLYKRAREATGPLLTLVRCGESVGFSEELIDGRASYPNSVVTASNVSRVHWLGEATGIIMERVHLTGYPSAADEKLYEQRLEEIRARDHVELVRRMDLCVFEQSVGAGLVLWAPAGATMRRTIEEYLYRLHMLRGYQPVVTPHVVAADLYKVSGHLELFRENMFVFEHEGRTHVVKPMNCPLHIAIVKRKRWSYKDLPLRYFELGTVYRFERGGTLHGLVRVRGMTQDDAHIFAREDQIEEEVERVLDLLQEVYEAFGVTEYFFKLSLRDPSSLSKYLGDEELWREAERALEAALKARGASFSIDLGGAAFYGPKIDVVLRDSLEREWQCGTIQLDFNLPRRFGLTYTDASGGERYMVMIHRALIGTIERFAGILLEYYAGRVPLWVAPLQVAILPVEEENEEQLSYAKHVAEELKARRVRAEVFSEGRLSARIRAARSSRVPMIAVVGEREVSSRTLSVTRIRYGVDERRRYAPREERFEATPEELASMIIEETKRATRGVMP
ncbi:MAG: threonine--tRNA ligase, partial [Fervidicoccaceae archaeon]